MPIDVKPGMTRQDKIAALAGAMTQMHMDALGELSRHGIVWWDIAYASILALRSVGAIHCADSLEKGDDEVRRIFECALKQSMVAKRFKDEEEMKQWAEAEGIDANPEDGVAIVPLAKPKGPVH